MKIKWKLEQFLHEEEFEHSRSSNTTVTILVFRRSERMKTWHLLIWCHSLSRVDDLSGIRRLCLLNIGSKRVGLVLVVALFPGRKGVGEIWGCSTICCGGWCCELLFTGGVRGFGAILSKGGYSIICCGGWGWYCVTGFPPLSARGHGAISIKGDFLTFSWGGWHCCERLWSFFLVGRGVPAVLPAVLVEASARNPGILVAEAGTAVQNLDWCLYWAFAL